MKSWPTYYHLWRDSPDDFLLYVLVSRTPAVLPPPHASAIAMPTVVRWGARSFMALLRRPLRVGACRCGHGCACAKCSARRGYRASAPMFRTSQLAGFVYEHLGMCRGCCMRGAFDRRSGAARVLCVPLRALGSPQPRHGRRAAHRQGVRVCSGVVRDLPHIAHSRHRVAARRSDTDCM